MTALRAFVCAVALSLLVLHCEALANNNPDRRQNLVSLFKSNGVPLPVATDQYGSLSDGPPPIECLVCQDLVSIVRGIIRENKTVDIIELLATETCIKQKVHGGNPEVCAGMVREYGWELVYIMTQKYLDPLWACTALKMCTRTISVTPEAHEAATAPFKREYPAGPKAKDPRKNDPDVGYFVQISDVHYDSEYSEGSQTDCGKPLCCRAADGPGTTPATKAPKFGHFNCDTSPAMLEAMVSSLKEHADNVDFVLWTGDDPPHDVWEQSRDENLAAAYNVTQAILQAFPKTPVYPVIGNHESYPVDQFEGPPYDSWLYDSLADYWKQWLDPAANQSLRYAGYYSQLVGPKFRVVTVNTQFCLPTNFWLILNDTDPGGQLAWLENTLEQSKVNGETVYLVGHVPWASGKCLEAYAFKVYKLIDQYADIIAGQFYGHTHHSNFIVYRDVATNTKPTSVAWICPSITPMGNINPTYRIYQYNRTSKQVLDYSDYTMNLTEANASGNAEFNLVYSAREAYSLPSMSPDSYQNFVSRIDSNQTLFDIWYTHHNAGVPTPCDEHCEKAMKCGFISPDGDYYKQCVGSGDDLAQRYFDEHQAC